MPRNGSGTYTLPQAPFVAGTTIDPVAMNSDLSDIAQALTNSMASDGQTPLSGGFRQANGSALAPSYSFSADTNVGMFHPSQGTLAFAVGGKETIDFVAPSLTNGVGLLGAGGSVLRPIGVIWDYVGSVQPPGWLWCNGQAVDRTTYTLLYQQIGTQFGPGNGSTTFNVPDYRGRVAAGCDTMGGLGPAGRLTITIDTPGTPGGQGGVEIATDPQSATGGMFLFAYDHNEGTIITIPPTMVCNKIIFSGYMP